MLIYTENLKDLAKYLLELINSLSKLHDKKFTYKNSNISICQQHTM